jgi:hypothetical protein
MVAVTVAMAGRAESLKPQADALVTVFTYDRTGVPPAVMAGAERVATAAFAAAGIEVRWVEGKRLGELLVSDGEILSVVFDGPAPAHFASQALAFTTVDGGGDADVHVFYSRVVRCEDHMPGLAAGPGAYLPQLLGNVVAHELTHALEGVVRHSSDGLMRAVWSAREYAEMVRGPLAFNAVDLALLRTHFKKGTASALALATAR